MPRKPLDETATCPSCGSHIPVDAIFCGECGRALQPPRPPEDATEVQDLLRRAFAERELAAAAATVQHETLEEAAARRRREYLTGLRWLHLPTVRSAFTATLGLPDNDPGAAAVPWRVSGSNDITKQGNPEVPILFVAHVNGVRIEAAVLPGQVTFTGVQDPSRRVPIIDLTSFATAVDRS